MFELPFVRANKRIRSRRKLRYQYIDAVNKRHQRLDYKQKHFGLPTPEASAAEEVSDTNQDEEALDKRRRMRKRRLQSILGEAGSDSNDSDVEEEDEHQTDDYEKKYFSRHHKPQDTYEIWTTDKKRKIPMNRTTISYSECKYAEKSAQARISSKMVHSSKNLRYCFDALKAGYEICPRQHQDSHHNTHITHLNELLHLNIMKGHWSVAYRCFSILIRMPGIDIRSIWGAGVRILHNVSHLDASIGDSDEFLAWMSSVYSSRATFNQATNHILDPVFRSGSKTHTPKFVTTWLWEALITSSLNNNKSSSTSSKNVMQGPIKLELLIEKISELVHIPPYMDDAGIWFIYATCHVVMVDQLSQLFLDSDQDFNDSRRDIARNQVIQHITTAKNCLYSCERKGDNYQFPKGLIMKHLAEFENRLYQQDDISRESHSESEEEKPLPDDFDTQAVRGFDWSMDEEANYFGGSERVQFGVESDSSD